MASIPLSWVQTPDGRWHLYGGVCDSPPEEDPDVWVMPPMPHELREILERLVDQSLPAVFYS